MYIKPAVPMEKNQQTWYAIKVPGRILTNKKYASRHLAEQELDRWALEAADLAEIVLVDSESRELLFESK